MTFIFINIPYQHRFRPNIPAYTIRSVYKSDSCHVSVIYILPFFATLDPLS